MDSVPTSMLTVGDGGGSKQTFQPSGDYLEKDEGLWEVVRKLTERVDKLEDEKKNDKKEIDDLRKRVEELVIDNNRLRGLRGEVNELSQLKADCYQESGKHFTKWSIHRFYNRKRAEMEAVGNQQAIEFLDAWYKEAKASANENMLVAGGGAGAVGWAVAGGVMYKAAEMTLLASLGYGFVLGLGVFLLVSGGMWVYKEIRK